MGKLLRKAKKAIGLLDTVKGKEEDKELLERIRGWVELDDEATQTQRALEIDDQRFRTPDTQWTDEDRRDREDSGRPVLVEDHLGPFIKQVCNEQRKNKPGVQVNPVGSGADVQTAEVLQGIIRHIEYSSNADTAYDTAVEWQVSSGRGFYRICTDWVPGGFTQEAQIRRVANPWMVFVDPSAMESDYSDMKWGGFKAWLSREDYKDQYPKSELGMAGIESWKSIGDDAPDWMNKDGGAVMVVECFYQEKRPAKLYRLQDDSIVDELKEGETAIESRDYVKTEVKWVKCTAVEILERGEFPSQYIPIIPVLGEEIIHPDGSRTYAGLIRSGKDPQKRLNYLVTSEIERIAFMPLATWLGPEGFMGKNKALWNKAHKTQMATLEFKIIGDEGQGINAPRLITEEAPIMAVTRAKEGAIEGMKSVLGMFDPSLGNRSGDQSGVAITRLQAQGETGNYHFQDNLARAQRYEGRILLDVIRNIMDVEEIVRIIGEDGNQQTVKINGPIQNPQEAMDEHKGFQGIYDVTTGKYDVTISSGPSYQSKRQEDRALLVSMLQGPMGQQIATAVPDLLASTLDSPIAKKMAERFHKMLPPQLQDAPDGQQPIPPQLQQQIQASEQQKEQMGQMIEALSQKVHVLSDQVEGKDAELAMKWKIAQLQERTKAVLGLATLGSADAKAQLEAEIKATENDLDRQHDINLSLLDHAKALEQQAQPIPQAISASGETQDTSASGNAGGEEE